MSLNPESAHIQTGLTISDGLGLFVDNLNEETIGNGVNLNSSLKTSKDVTFLGLTGNSTIDLVGNSLQIKNEIGPLVITSLGDKGITVSGTTGNVNLNSTTDSFDTLSGSFVTSGGVGIGKALNVGDNINCNNFVSTFTNSVDSERVIHIQNTSSLGYSSIGFFSESDLPKLEVGYGNSVTGSLSGVSYISSKTGSELLIQSDSNDSMLVKTNGSIDFFNTFSSTSSTTGSLRLLGGIGISNGSDAVSTSNGGSFTTAGGMAIGKKLFIGNSVNYSSVVEPGSVTSGVTSFYVDIADSLFKSKNNIGVVTVYQPANTKGDIAVHNGITSVRLPIGSNGYSLVANSSTTTGVEWKQITGNGGISSSNKYTLYGSIFTNVIEQVTGSNIFWTYPRVKNGSSCIFFTAKSSSNLNGIVSRFNSNTSLNTNGTISGEFQPYLGFEVSKNYIEGDGDYIGNSNETENSLEVTLNGTNWVNYGTELIGSVCLSIKPVNDGPCATFIVSKSSFLLSNGAVTRIISSPGNSGGTLRMRWPSTGVIQISKSNVSDDGTYIITNNFQDTTLTENIVLSNTTRTTVNLFKYYTCKSFLVKINSGINGYPCGIFSVSKNSVSRIGNVSRYRSPGSSGELLNVHWDSTSLFEISKNGSGSDGNYTVLFTKLT